MADKAESLEEIMAKQAQGASGAPAETRLTDGSGGGELAPTELAQATATAMPDGGSHLGGRSMFVLYCFDGHGLLDGEGNPATIERPAIVIRRETRSQNVLAERGAIKRVKHPATGKLVTVRTPDRYEKVEDEFTDLRVFLLDEDRKRGLHEEQLSQRENTEDPGRPIDGTWRDLPI